MILQQPQARWWDDIHTPAVETRVDILRKSLQEAVEEARQRFGADPAKWQWAKLHSAVFAHPFGRVWPLDWLLNRAVLAGGDGHTVNMTYYQLDQSFAGVAGPTFRMVVDLADIAHAFAMNTTGQSGRLFSRHYDDMIQSWAEATYHPMWMDETDILAHAEGTLLLIPEVASGAQPSPSLEEQQEKTESPVAQSD